MTPRSARALKRADVDDAIKAILEKRRAGAASRMYEMLEYFFGFRDAALNLVSGTQSGKRYRPELCLIIAGGYGAEEEKALTAALAIELFHNFTLIHDDIEDRDEMRRGRPTLWKAFGVPRAINAGDALSLIAYETGATLIPTARDVLFSAFTEVIEGQHLDFELASQAIGSETVSRACYMESSEKKTGALVGAAAEIAGICAGQNENECALLRTYGRSLGTAHQLIDDYRSVWSSSSETGKDAHSDIREHKRTLPFFFAYEETAQKARLAELYSLDRQLSDAEINKARTLIDATSARSRVLEEIRTYADRCRKAAEALALPADIRATLIELVNELVPEAR